MSESGMCDTALSEKTDIGDDMQPFADIDAVGNAADGLAPFADKTGVSVPIQQNGVIEDTTGKAASKKRKRTTRVKDSLVMWVTQSFPRKYITNFEVGSERNLRDAEITKLLRIYVIMYRMKVVTTSIFKFIYPLITLFILCIIIAAILYIVAVCIQHIDVEVTMTGLTAVISSLVALLAALFSNLKHLWKYLYDKNDESHVAEIVKAVQENDLKNKQSEANMQNFLESQARIGQIAALKKDIQHEQCTAGVNDKTHT